ncbi:hypothetical protein A5764_21455 [Mycobacterium sp. 852002-51057_SCH5723018]|nr:hypothetical protein A5764_21455 [Mycobacterium sp. 852002-51057_SCH5723018]
MLSPAAVDLVVLADYLIADPRMVRDLHRQGVPHLPVRVRDGTGLVGPAGDPRGDQLPGLRLSGTTFSEVTPSTRLPHSADRMKQPTDRRDVNRNRESRRGYTFTPGEQAAAFTASPYNEAHAHNAIRA